MNLRSQHAYDPSSSSQVAPLTVKATLFFLAVLFSLISISLRVFHAFRERKAPGVSWLSELWLVRKLKKAQGTYYVTNGMLLWHLGTVCGALLFGVYCALAAAGAAGNPVKGDAVLWALVGSPIIGTAGWQVVLATLFSWASTSIRFPTPHPAVFNLGLFMLPLCVSIVTVTTALLLNIEKRAVTRAIQAALAMGSDKPDVNIGAFIAHTESSIASLRCYYEAHVATLLTWVALIVAVAIVPALGMIFALREAFHKPQKDDFRPSSKGLHHLEKRSVEPQRRQNQLMSIFFAWILVWGVALIAVMAQGLHENMSLSNSQWIEESMTGEPLGGGLSRTLWVLATGCAVNSMVLLVRDLFGVQARRSEGAAASPQTSQHSSVNNAVRISVHTESVVHFDHQRDLNLSRFDLDSLSELEKQSTTDSVGEGSSNETNGAFAL